MIVRSQLCRRRPATIGSPIAFALCCKALLYCKYIRAKRISSTKTHYWRRILASTQLCPSVFCSNSRGRTQWIWEVERWSTQKIEKHTLFRSPPWNSKERSNQWIANSSCGLVSDENFPRNRFVQLIWGGTAWASDPRFPAAACPWKAIRLGPLEQTLRLSNWHPPSKRKTFFKCAHVRLPKIRFLAFRRKYVCKENRRYSIEFPYL